MRRRQIVLLRDVIDELANSLQIAVGLAGHVQQSSRASATEAIQLEAALGRAVAALKRLEPRAPQTRGRR
jgi:hypothetical protein